MARRFVTLDEIESLATGAELTLPPGTVLTELALEAAAARGIKLRTGESSAQGQAPAVMMQSVVAIGSDHGGYDLKEYLKPYLEQWNYLVMDCGTFSRDAVDYPDFARAVAEAVQQGKAWRGIVVDGAGIGSAMAANKIPGIRAALCYDRPSAINSREHNDANLLTLGARLLQPEEAREVAAVWLRTRFAGGRHQQRVDKIMAIEKAQAAGSGAAAGSAVRPGTAGVVEPGTKPGASPDLAQEVTAQVIDYLRGQGICVLQPGEAACTHCDGGCVGCCPDKARAVLQAGAARLSTAPGLPPVGAEIASVIDHTLLRADATLAEILKLCEEARNFGFASVCINPAWVACAAQALRGTAVKVCTVAGFPLGATTAAAKSIEAELALRQGAQEVDMVIQVGALKSGQYERVEQDIRGVVEACHRAGALCKVIIECALLTGEEKVRACCLAKSAGADFVKTSTGFGPGGATAADVELMRLAVGAEMGVKAAGGIRTYEDLKKMVAAGATRIGASASVKILQQAAADQPQQGKVEGSTGKY